MMTKFDPQTLDPRSAYRVKRYHTWDVIHQQTSGEHSAQVWRILKAIWPDAPAHVLEHAMTHDIGEKVAGDPPYPVKASDPELKARLDALEEAGHLQMCLPWHFPPPVKLAPLEQTIFKLAEYIEMWEYGLDELTLGNRGARLVCDRMMNAIEKKLEELGWDEIPFVLTVKPVSVSETASVYIAHRQRFYEMVTDELVTGETVP